MAFAGYDRYRILLLEQGIELFEVKPVLGRPDFGSRESLRSSGSGQYASHAKLVVFDRRRVVVGSINFDQRSWRGDVEGQIVTLGDGDDKFSSR
jgi:putative cardiolipin synthase